MWQAQLQTSFHVTTFRTSDDQKRPFASVAMVHSVPELVVSDEVVDRSQFFCV